MMSASTFKKESNIRFHRRKNPIILDIDRLLEEYEKSHSENRKMKCAVYIYMMCKHYFYTKPNGRRGDAVGALMQQCKDLLNSPQFAKQIAEKVGGRHYSSGAQQNLMSTGNKTATSMSPGYGWEGILPQKNFVEKLGLNLDELLGPDTYYGASTINQYFTAQAFEKGATSEAAASAWAHSKMTSGPLTEILDALHALWQDHGTTYAKGFHYLNCEGRADYLVVIQGGGRLTRRTGATISTGTPGDNKPFRIYAMDTCERLYALGSGDVGEGVTWNHSSLLSGHPVICAGMITVFAGVLQKIDNASGHYKPDTRNLVDCVKAIRAAGVNPGSFSVHDQATDTTYPTASNFLAMNP